MLDPFAGHKNMFFNVTLEAVMYRLTLLNYKSIFVNTCLLETYEHFEHRAVIIYLRLKKNNSNSRFGEYIRKMTVKR